MSRHNYQHSSSGHVQTPELEIRFLGRESAPDRLEALSQQPGSPTAIAALEQIHSAIVLPARDGSCGEGDGLWTTRKALALSIATADCVPLVLAGSGRLAAVHAGWRGIVDQIAGEAVRILGKAESLSAWMGPSIRGCCYEVSTSVARDLVRASDPSAARQGRGRRPHLDLVTAVAVQLRHAGVGTIYDLSPCTHCHHTRYWSYRRLGARAGRNYTFAWLTGADEGFA